MRRSYTRTELWRLRPLLEAKFKASDDGNAGDGVGDGGDSDSSHGDDSGDGDNGSGGDCGVCNGCAGDDCDGGDVIVM